MQEYKDRLLSVLPQTGEMPYEQLRNQLLQNGDRAALGQFHHMRRAGELAIRLEQLPNGGFQMFVSRP